MARGMTDAPFGTHRAGQDGRAADLQAVKLQCGRGSLFFSGSTTEDRCDITSTRVTPTYEGEWIKASFYRMLLI
jgi:hypothetical protein